MLSQIFSFRGRFLSVYILSTLLLVAVLLGSFINHEKAMLLKNTKIRMQYTANRISQEIFKLDANHTENALQSLENKFKDTPFVLLDTESHIKLSNIGAFVMYSSKDPIQAPQFIAKKHGLYFMDNSPQGNLGISSVMIVEEMPSFMPLYKTIGLIFLSACLFIALIARWLYKINKFL
ncbi:hypothetical protein [Helicobacter cetorum]|uniref:hypothetical protein n=1 Tax=Helicobacter cetorum TaxID=138563 RepID=UPI000CF13F5E|nr:hypothetical protein [Helicobacter cetorum]